METEIDLAELQAQWDEIMDYLSEFFAALAEHLKAMLDAIMEKIVKPFTRKLFALRLCYWGLPDWLADLISRKCPWRWMPVEWVYEPWTR